MNNQRSTLSNISTAGHGVSKYKIGNKFTVDTKVFSVVLCACLMNLLGSRLTNEIARATIEIVEFEFIHCTLHKQIV